MKEQRYCLTIGGLQGQIYTQTANSLMLSHTERSKNKQLQVAALKECARAQAIGRTILVPHKMPFWGQLFGIVLAAVGPKFKQVTGSTSGWNEPGAGSSALVNSPLPRKATSNVLQDPFQDTCLFPVHISAYLLQPMYATASVAAFRPSLASQGQSDTRKGKLGSTVQAFADPWPSFAACVSFNGFVAFVVCLRVPLLSGSCGGQMQHHLF